MKHNKNDIKFFTLRKKTYIEDDMFTYFYPFCFFNCTGITIYIFRKNSWLVLGLATLCMIEYIYFLFSFPVESWYFHKRAISSDKPYAQFLRDSYIERFPNSRKATQYREINEKLDKKYTSSLKILKI